MPSVYAATLNVLTTTRDRLKSFGKTEEGEDWTPDRILDFGSGTGSAAWAFESTFGAAKADGSAREYIGLDASRPMVELSSGLFGAIPLRRTDDGQVGTQATSTRLDAKSHQLVLPASSSSLAKLQISPKSAETQKTIALAAFSLGDLPTKEKRKDLIRSMWQSGAEVIVIIDRGTPAGSRIVIEAREQLLGLGRREVSRAVASEIDPELAEEGLDIVVDPEVASEIEVDPSLGSHVIAPVRRFSLLPSLAISSLTTSIARSVPMTSRVLCIMSRKRSVTSLSEVRFLLPFQPANLAKAKSFSRSQCKHLLSFD